uniref:Uncharacterized protein n=1 Tax=Oryza glumipatula TaxID=40148 RepID=A0A0D9ZM53_9ORYZ
MKVALTRGVWGRRGVSGGGDISGSSCGHGRIQWQRRRRSRAGSDLAVAMSATVLGARPDPTTATPSRCSEPALRLPPLFT